MTESENPGTATEQQPGLTATTHLQRRADRMTAVYMSWENQISGEINKLLENICKNKLM